MFELVNKLLQKTSLVFKMDNLQLIKFLSYTIIRKMSARRIKQRCLLAPLQTNLYINKTVERNPKLFPPCIQLKKTNPKQTLRLHSNITTNHCLFKLELVA